MCSGEMARVVSRRTLNRPGRGFACGTVVVGTDFSPLAGAAVQSAVAIAKQVSAKRLNLVHVVDQLASDDAPAIASLVADAEQKLAELIQDAGLVDVATADVRVGKPAEELRAAAESLQADLLVVASHGYGPIRRALLGSVACDLVREAMCPLLVVAEDRRLTDEVKTVLAAVDDSAVAGAVLLHAVGLASSGGGRLHVLSILSGLDPSEAAAKLAAPAAVGPRIEARLRELESIVESMPSPPLEVDLEVRSMSAPSTVIDELANSLTPDLIVIGTSGRSRWRRVIAGATADSVVTGAPCPVLVVPHEAVRVKDMSPATDLGGSLQWEA